jgi:hypothetical protein
MLLNNFVFYFHLETWNILRIQASNLCVGCVLLFWELRSKTLSILVTIKVRTKFRTIQNNRWKYIFKHCKLRCLGRKRTEDSEPNQDLHFLLLLLQRRYLFLVAVFKDFIGFINSCDIKILLYFVRRQRRTWELSPSTSSFLYKLAYSPSRMTGNS